MATVLVVEDDPVFNLAVSQCLTTAGYAVVTVTDSVQALAELDSPRPIDLAIIDVLMPAGLPNGMTLAAMADARRRHLPIIFVSASPELARGRIASDQPVLGKPIDLETLLIAVSARIGV